MKYILILPCLLLVCNPLSAAVYTSSVEVDNNSISASTLPNGAGDGAGLLWNINPGFQLEPIDYTIGIGHVWYEVSVFDTIDPLFTGIGIEFANAFTDYTGGSIAMTLNTPFILGFWLDADGDDVADIDDRYGWAELEYDGASLHLLRNAISDTGSIEAGVVPEPSACLLLVGGVLMLSCTRQRKNA